MIRLVGAALVLLAGCRPDPGWARLESGVLGESTQVGAPLPVPHLPVPPQLDGKLDDAVWATTRAAGPLVQAGDGAAAPGHPVAAVARLAWDDGHLYVGFVVHDRSPTSPFQRGDDDPHVWGASSGVELMLQPGDFADNRDYYELQIDVAGAVFDSHFEDYNQPITGEGKARRFGHQEWSSRAERAVYVRDGHFYSIEAAIPWSAFAGARVAIPPRPGDVWRLNLYTFRDGQRQALAWSPLRGQGNFHRTARFGRIHFE